MNARKLLVMNQPDISQIIRELRLERGLTQEQFASELGVTYSTINRWETGHKVPLRLAIQKLEEMLLSIGGRGKYLFNKYLAE